MICLFALQSSTGEGSPSSKAALLRAAKRSKSASKPVEDSQFRVLAPGQDLSLKLLTRAAKYGGIVHAIQPIFVPEIIARCGMRWWKAQFNPQITNYSAS
jgi:hypothetical protein